MASFLIFNAQAQQNTCRQQERIFNFLNEIISFYKKYTFFFVKTMDKKSDSIPIPGPSRLVQALTAIKTYDTREPNQVSYFFLTHFL